MVETIRQYRASALGALLAVVGWTYLVATGVTAVSAGWLVVVVAVQAASGGIIWTLVRGDAAGPVERVAMGLSLGTVAAVLCGLLGKVLLGTSAGWWAPAAVALILWVVHGIRAGSEPGPRGEGLTRGALVGAAAAVLLGLLSLVPNLLSYPLTWAGTWSRYHPDMLFFEALSTSLAHLGPLDSIFTPGAQVRYHWLVYAWSGQVADAAHAAPFVVLVRVLPFVAVVGAGLLAVAWTVRLSKAVWAPALAVVLLTLGGYVGATYGAIFNFDSPSQAMTSMWLLAFGLAVASFVGRGDASHRAWPEIGVIAALAFSLAGGKISTGAMAVAGVLWLAVIGVLGRHTWRRRAVVAGAATLAGFVLGYLLIVAGSADPGGLQLLSLLDRGSSVQGLNPVPGGIGIVLGTVILMLSIAARWSGLLWFVSQRETRWRVDTQLGLGFALGALATVVALSGGLNDTWFALAASAPLAVLSAAGVGEAWLSTGPKRWRILWAALAVAVIALAVTLLLWATGASGGNEWVSTWRWAAPLTGVALAAVGGGVLARRLSGRVPRAGLAGALLGVVLLTAAGRLTGVGTDLVGVQPGLSSEAFSPVTGFTESIDRTAISEWSDGQVSAASWLRENGDESDLVATNVTFSPLVPALTARRSFVAGILYQAPYGRPGIAATLLERERQSWAFVDEPTGEHVEPLCAAGVRWVWVDPTRTEATDWEPYAKAVIMGDAVVILDLAPYCEQRG